MKRILPFVCTCITIGVAVPVLEQQHQPNVSCPQCSGTYSATMTAAGSFRHRSPMVRTMGGGTTGAHGRRARKPAGQGSPVRSDSAGMSLLHLANYLQFMESRSGKGVA